MSRVRIPLPQVIAHLVEWVDTVDLKFTPLAGVSVQLRGWVAGMVELEDTMDLGSIGLGCASSTLVTCIPFFSVKPLSSKGRTPLFLSGNAGSSPTRGVWMCG